MLNIKAQPVPIQKQLQKLIDLKCRSNVNVMVTR